MTSSVSIGARATSRADGQTSGCTLCSNRIGLIEIEDNAWPDVICSKCSFLKDLLRHCGDWRPNLIYWHSNEGRWAPFTRSMGTVQFYTREGDPKPFNDMPTWRVDEATGTDETLRRAQSWLARCDSSHDCFRRLDADLPKRLIDVGLSPTDAIRLYETRAGETADYACLSHSWGASVPPCRTTLATLEEYKQEIPRDSIPATFRDAMDFTRRLGLRYIWIDSTCIIQDCPTDWAQQAALMADIYGGAYITLCATAAQDCHSGLYLPIPMKFRSRRIEIQHRNGWIYNIYLRKNPRWFHLSEKSVDSSKYPGRPLLTRAWAFQERLLSQRLLHFVEGEIMWQCHKLDACECLDTNQWMQSTEGRGSLALAVGPASTETSLDESARQWRDITGAYSSLLLTYEGDRLPALSGIAKRMLAQRLGDKYLAGLWMRTLVRDLCWSLSVVSFRRRQSQVLKRPTWSWMSVDSGLSLVGSQYITEEYAEIVDAAVTLAGPDPTGAVVDGKIRLRGPLIWVESKKPDEDGLWDSMLFNGDHKAYWTPDSDIWASKTLISGESVACVRLAGSDREDFCLVLQPASVSNVSGEVASTEYRRLGLAVLDLRKGPKSHWFSPSMQLTEISLI